MNIYFSHSQKIDYRKYYEVLLNLKSVELHNYILPHRNNIKQYNSLDLFKNGQCDLVIAEVSKPSLGVGIELGWADFSGIKIFAAAKKSAELSASIEKVADRIILYASLGEFAKLIKKEIDGQSTNN